jgi:flagellar FliL protein
MSEQVLEGADIPVEKKKGLSKMLIIIIAAVVVLGGGGAGAFFLMKGHSAEKPVDAKDAKAAPAKGPPTYIPLDPPFVVNFENQAAVRFLQVSVQILTRDSGTAELLKLHEPVIRNDLLFLLGNQQYATIVSREGKEKLRQQSLEAVRKVIANEGGKSNLVEQVFFTSFVMQ